MKDKILQRILSFYEEIVDDSEQTMVKDEFGRAWRNRDNIQYGELGHLFFLFQLSVRSKNREMQAAIYKKVEALSVYSKQHNTNNYTLYCGRMGLVLLYLEMFRFFKERPLLDEALDIARQHVSGYSLYLMMLNNNSLFEGISGITLGLLHLYAESKEEWILPYIENYSSKLIRRAKLGNCGVFWDGTTQIDKKKVGLAYGNSGIAFTLLELGRFFDNELCISLAEQSLIFEDDYCKANQSDVICSEVMEVQLVRIYADHMLGESRYSGASEVILSTADRILRFDISSGEGGTIRDIACVGLSCLEAFKLTGSKRFQEFSMLIMERIFQTWTIERRNETDWSIEIREFLFGMLDMENEDGLLSLTLPYIQSVVKSGDKKEGLCLPANRQDMYDIILSKSFAFSYPLFKEKFPGEVCSFINGAHGELLNEFKATANSLLVLAESSGEGKNILDTGFRKDCFLLEAERLFSDSGQGVNEDRFINNALEVLSLKSEVFMLTQFEQTAGIWVFEGEPAFDITRKLKYDEFVEFFSTYGTDSLACISTSSGTLKVEDFTINKLVYDRFNIPCTVKDATSILINFIYNQPAKAIEVIKYHYNVKDDDHFFMMMEKTAMNTVKYFVSEGMLFPSHRQMLSV